MNSTFTYSKRAINFLLILLLFGSSHLFATKHNVSVTSNKFTPDNLTIFEGDTVVWTCTQGTHNVNGTTARFPNNPVSFGNNVGSNWTYQFVFQVAGEYDYQCDPHAALGMTGKITVNQNIGPFTLTIDFLGMNPHVGQMFFLRAIDQDTGEELIRMQTVIENEFQMLIPGVLADHDYTIDFFADHNGNGIYDKPPVDHAWSLDVNNITGNTLVNFAHNTTFTDIAWKYKLTVEFSGMTPHVGELFNFYIKNRSTLNYVDTVSISQLPDPAFEIVSYAIAPGNSYTIDFFADHNGNGMYDAPPVDHAWRLNLDNVQGDTVITFVHNTNFTNIFGSSGLETDTDYQRFMIYPNPASDQLAITYDLTGDHRVNISVFNLSGQKIWTIMDQNQPAGKYVESVDLHSMVEGIYFIRVQTGTGAKIHRLVVSR